MVPRWDARDRTCFPGGGRVPGRSSAAGCSPDSRSRGAASGFGFGVASARAASPSFGSRAEPARRVRGEVGEGEGAAPSPHRSGASPTTTGARAVSARVVAHATRAARVPDAPRSSRATHSAPTSRSTRSETRRTGDEDVASHGGDPPLKGTGGVFRGGKRNIRRMRDARPRPAPARPPRPSPARVPVPPRRFSAASLHPMLSRRSRRPSHLSFSDSDPWFSLRAHSRLYFEPAAKLRDERGGHHEGERTRQERERRRTASRAHSPTERPTWPSESPRRRVRARGRRRRRCVGPAGTATVASVYPDGASATARFAPVARTISAAPPTRGENATRLAFTSAFGPRRVRALLPPPRARRGVARDAPSRVKKHQVFHRASSRSNDAFLASTRRDGGRDVHGGRRREPAEGLARPDVRRRGGSRPGAATRHREHRLTRGDAARDARPTRRVRVSVGADGGSTVAAPANRRRVHHALAVHVRGLRVRRQEHLTHRAAAVQMHHLDALVSRCATNTLGAAGCRRSARARRRRRRGTPADQSADVRRRRGAPPLSARSSAHSAAADAPRRRRWRARRTWWRVRPRAGAAAGPPRA